MNAPPFFLHQLTHVDQARFYDAWSAPVGYFEAERGFGESIWMDATPDTVLVLCLTDTPVQCCFGRRPASGPGRRITLQPRGTPNHFLARERIHFAELFLGDTLLDRASDELEQPALSRRLRDDLVFMPDPALHQRTHDYVRRALDRRDPPSAIEMEGRALLVLDSIFRLHARGAGNPGGLAAWQLRRACDCIEDNLAREVTLSELAALTRLSVFHFARAFKASMGMPPHRWQVERRIQRARELLEGTDQPIITIASAVGYLDPSHFATVFRRHVGVPPSEYRRQRQH